jgi:ABC-type polysaccharide/polyol phosphate export permease
MLEDLRELWRYRELLLILVRRDLKVRYKNSVLGFGWSLANPLLQVATITLMIQFLYAGSSAKQSPAESFHVYVFCATLPWLFFSTATLDASASLVSYFNLIKRTYFPREIIPITTVIASLVHFLLATAVFLGYEVLNSVWWWSSGQGFHWPIRATFLLVPIPMLGLILLVTGISLFVSVWTLYFEDFRFLADSSMKILYWLVPVFYFADVIRFKKGNALYTLYMLNPVSCFITTFRKLTLPPTKIPILGHPDLTTSPMTGQDWLLLGVALLVSTGVFLLGHRYFSSRKWALAERP